MLEVPKWSLAVALALMVAFALGRLGQPVQKVDLDVQIASLRSDLKQEAESLRKEMRNPSTINSSPAQLYGLFDIERRQDVGTVMSVTPLKPGDFVHVGENVWAVQRVDVMTGPMPNQDGVQQAVTLAAFVRFAGKAPNR